MLFCAFLFLRYVSGFSIGCLWFLLCPPCVFGRVPCVYGTFVSVLPVVCVFVFLGLVLCVVFSVYVSK